MLVAVSLLDGLGVRVSRAVPGGRAVASIRKSAEVGRFYAPAEVTKSVQDPGRGAGVDGIGSMGDPFPEIRCDADCFESGSRVEKNHIAFGSGLGAVQDGFQNRGVALRGVSTLQLAEAGGR